MGRDGRRDWEFEDFLEDALEQAEHDDRFLTDDGALDLLTLDDLALIGYRERKEQRANTSEIPAKRLTKAQRIREADKDAPRFEGMIERREPSPTAGFEPPENVDMFATPEGYARLKYDPARWNAFIRYRQAGTMFVIPPGVGQVARFVTAASLMVRGWPEGKINEWIARCRQYTKGRWVANVGRGGRLDHRVSYRVKEARKEGRTAHPEFVRDWIGEGEILKKGHNNRKLGNIVLNKQGKDIGRIYSMTLEERATCPTDCSLWDDCYGNAMRQATRWRYEHERRDELFEALENNISSLVTGLNKKGLALYVRLHELGDFPSKEYVEFWGTMLERYPTLHVWGYTHRRPGNGDGIAAAIHNLNDRYWHTRWRIYDSDTFAKKRSANVFDSLDNARGKGHTPCWEQQGITGTCGECGLCLPGKETRGGALESNIAFGKH